MGVHLQRRSLASRELITPAANVASKRKNDVAVSVARIFAVKTVLESDSILASQGYYAPSVLPRVVARRSWIQKGL